MTDDLDRVLSNEPEIRPSDAFLASVMAAVERESSGPPPIPFPWLRALPLAAAALALAAFIVISLGSADSAAPPSVLSTASEVMVRTASTPVAIWATVGLLVSAASACVPFVRLER